MTFAWVLVAWFGVSLLGAPLIGIMLRSRRVGASMRDAEKPAA